MKFLWRTTQTTNWTRKIAHIPIFYNVPYILFIRVCVYCIMKNRNVTIFHFLKGPSYSHWCASSEHSFPSIHKGGPRSYLMTAVRGFSSFAVPPARPSRIFLSRAPNLHFLFFFFLPASRCPSLNRCIKLYGRRPDARWTVRGRGGWTKSPLTDANRRVPKGRRIWSEELDRETMARWCRLNIYVIFF